MFSHFSSWALIAKSKHCFSCLKRSGAALIHERHMARSGLGCYGDCCCLCQMKKTTDCLWVFKSFVNNFYSTLLKFAKSCNKYFVGFAVFTLSHKFWGTAKYSSVMFLLKRPLFYLWDNHSTFNYFLCLHTFWISFTMAQLQGCHHASKRIVNWKAFAEHGSPSGNRQRGLWWWPLMGRSESPEESRCVQSASIRPGSCQLQSQPVCSSAAFWLLGLVRSFWYC